MSQTHDIEVVRRLASTYAQIAAKPIQQERRNLWAAHHSLKPTHTLIAIRFGMHNLWCRELFNENTLECEDPFFRTHERNLRMAIFQDSLGDDVIQEPWITQNVTVKGSPLAPWGLKLNYERTGMDGGAYKIDPPLKDYADLDKITPVMHEIDREKTALNVERLSEAVDGILPVDVMCQPFYSRFHGDISTFLARTRGLEAMMMDMCDHPDELHQLLSIMRDGILADHAAAEEAGDLSLTSQFNQSMPYAEELERPRANSGPRQRKDLWGFGAAQELAQVSPRMHDEFMFQYQMPILEKFGLVHYGCCENLTQKIGMLRQLKNLRSIAVTPSADVAKSAELIGKDYVMAWRPSPTDMVCCGWDEGRVGRILKDSLEKMKGCYVHIHLKDVETLEGDYNRLRRWVEVARDVCEQFS